MITRKEIAELAAMLATRAPARTYSYGRIAADALKLARYGSAAGTNAVNLCNIPDYQARYDRKAAKIKKGAQDVAGAYNLRAECNGDPRAGCLWLFSTDKTEIRGNSLGGDAEGFGL
jgi:hypothetical protein